MLEKFKKYKVDNKNIISLNDINGNSVEASNCKYNYIKEFECLQKQMFELQEKFSVDKTKKLLVILQGMDTSGKNSTIRQVFRGLNPQFARVASFSKPTTEELSYDFLWRIHKKVPSSGEIVIFDRSHYEDVLAVRVNELCDEQNWRKRFDHINNFEKMLFDEGTIILKFFLHIDKATQKKRLNKRLEKPSKNWKFDPTDLVAREKWTDYEKAYEEVFNKTSKDYAPWFIIPSNIKWARNLIIARIIAETLESLDLTYPKVSFNPDKIKVL